MPQVALGSRMDTMAHVRYIKDSNMTSRLYRQACLQLSSENQETKGSSKICNIESLGVMLEF